MINFKTEAEFRQSDVDRFNEMVDEIINDVDSHNWVDSPKLMRINNDRLAKVKEKAKEINEKSGILICIGIGGSYLGHKAVIEAQNKINSNKVDIKYLGNNLSDYEFRKVFEEIGEKDYHTLVISKSGNTLEVLESFAIVKKEMIRKYGPKYSNRVCVATGKKKNKLLDEAIQESYTIFDIPELVGGRFSVFTEGSLLAMAAAGIDIDEFLSGAELMKSNLLANKNKVIPYAVWRINKYWEGKRIEVFGVFEHRLNSLVGWWQQLFGETEGKNQGGLFPVGVEYTRDLHSLGQLMQEGERNIIETILWIENGSKNTDSKMNNILTSYNKIAKDATIAAHIRGGVPLFEISLINTEAKTIGAFMYQMMTMAVISAKLRGVNPYDQPGVEVYKAYMREKMK